MISETISLLNQAIFLNSESHNLSEEKFQKALADLELQVIKVCKALNTKFNKYPEAISLSKKLQKIIQKLKTG